MNMIPSFNKIHNGDLKPGRGFTLLELVVVLATLGLLAVLLAPALASQGHGGEAVQCLSNTRQLALAWRMYADDHGDTLPGNNWPFQGSPAATATFRAWAAGNMDFPTTTGWASDGTDSTNTALLLNINYTQLAAYIRVTNTYKCPSDSSTVQYVPGGPQLARVRSYSMNAAVGTPWQSGVVLPTGWLGGTNYGTPTSFQTYPRMSSIIKPSPASLWLIMDEHPDSINDTSLWVDCTDTNAFAAMLDVPASYHNGGASVAFADGHVEPHHWVDGRTKVPVYGTYDTSFDVFNGSPPIEPFNPDIAWLQARTSSPP